MTLVTLADGTEKDIDLDIDAICAYEVEHPEWSILDLFQRMDRMRFSDLNLLSSFIGFRDYDDALEQGVDMERMADIVQGSKYLGFTGSPDGEGRD